LWKLPDENFPKTMSSSSSFEKVGECLYRNPSRGPYYALVKIRGKQIKESLKAKILVEAKQEELENTQRTPENGQRGHMKIPYP
jgi:myo-inositol-hexaphosphate 3-phosphohydrolase